MILFWIVHILKVHQSHFFQTMFRQVQLHMTFGDTTDASIFASAGLCVFVAPPAAMCGCAGSNDALPPSLLPKRRGHFTNGDVLPEPCLAEDLRPRWACFIQSHHPTAAPISPSQDRHWVRPSRTQDELVCSVPGDNLACY